MSTKTIKEATKNTSKKDADNKNGNSVNAKDNSSDKDDADGPILGSGRSYFNDYGVAVGPITHIREEREQLLSAKWNNFSVQLMGATIGGLVSNIDLREELSDEIIAELRSALLAYKVLFFRDQPISSEQHVAFAKRFGELEVHPFLPGAEGVPELVRFEKSAEMGGYENGWHSDVTWREVPSMGAILHNIEAPAVGGDTHFADMCAIYDGLSDEMKERIDSLYAVHDYIQAFAVLVPEDKKEEMRKQYPPVTHPVVRTHPETGRKILYLNRFFVSHIEGIPKEESTELIDALCREADYQEYQCHFKWEKDSIAFWDNRAVQHYASSDYWPEVRIGERASIIGDRPV